MSFPANLVELEDPMLSEINQIEKDKYHVLCGSLIMTNT